MARQQEDKAKQPVRGRTRGQERKRGRCQATMPDKEQAAEQELARLIQEGIDQAEATGRVVDEHTARRIAAAVHRGLGGELERLAGTGELTNPQVARLELFHTLKGEPEFEGWGAALKRFIPER